METDSILTMDIFNIKENTNSSLPSLPRCSDSRETLSTANTRIHG
jgi:hypothetical protein